jgi:hypothetical protein
LQSGLDVSKGFAVTILDTFSYTQFRVSLWQIKIAIILTTAVDIRFQLEAWNYYSNYGRIGFLYSGWLRVGGTHLCCSTRFLLVFGLAAEHRGKRCSIEEQQKATSQSK